jgi:hypothetical protein
MRGKTVHRGTYFQPISYLDFWAAEPFLYLLIIHLRKNSPPGRNSVAFFKFSYMYKG